MEWNERELKAFEEENTGTRDRRRWHIVDRWWEALLNRVGINKEENDKPNAE